MNERIMLTERAWTRANTPGNKFDTPHLDLLKSFSCADTATSQLGVTINIHMDEKGQPIGFSYNRDQALG